MNREEAKKKAEALVARMTLEEKASQLRYDAPAIKDWEFRRITGGMRDFTVLPEQGRQRFFHRQSEWRQLLTGKVWQRWPVSWQQRAEQSIMHIP